MCVPCGKRFANRNVFDAHLSGKNHKKAVGRAGAAGGSSSGSGGSSSSTPATAASAGVSAVGDRSRRCAAAEWVVGRLLYAGVLGDELRASVSMVEKKMTRSARELEEEARAEAEGLAERVGAEAAAAAAGDDDESDEEAPIYNPLNLPLGWDGKPIPYWLYKVRPATRPAASPAPRRPVRMAAR